MLDLNHDLGRPVATAQQVIEVIRPELRMIRAFHRGKMDGIRTGWLQADPDLNLSDGGDDHAETVVFTALLDSGLDSVGSWSRDEGLVYDSAKVREFIRVALIAAMTEGDDHDALLPAGTLDY